MSFGRVVRSVAWVGLLALPLARAQEVAFEELAWRELGPSNMGGRVVDLAVDEKRPHRFYVAFATGGVFRTINNGTTFRSIFHDEGVASIGDIAMAPSDPEVLYVGTGEANTRNSVSPGAGIILDR